MDRDHSGTLELQEVQSALPEFPPDHVAKLFAEADRDKDGHLDRQEYTSFVSTCITITTICMNKLFINQIIISIL